MYTYIYNNGGPAGKAPLVATPALEPRAVPIGTVLDLGKTASQRCEAVPRRARIQGS